MLRGNGFDCVRQRKHEVWVRRNEAGAVEARTVLSHGSAQIRSRSPFAAILRQTGKTEAEFS